MRMGETAQPIATKPRYVWPWFLAAALLLGITICVLAIKHEAERVRLQKELQQEFPTTVK